MMKRKTAVIFGIIIAAQLCLTPYAGVKVQAAELEEGQMFEDSSEDSETFGDVSIPDTQSAEKTEENEFGDDDGFSDGDVETFSAEDADQFRENMQELVLNVQDGEDITVKLNTLLAQARDKATDEKQCKVIVPPGNYTLTGTLHMYSNIYLYAEGATITKTSPQKEILLRLGDTQKSAGGYEGYRNITIDGGTWDSNYECVEDKGGPGGFVGFRIGHATNVTVKNVIRLMNRTGFEHRTMSLTYEDGKNLNRVFPGNPNGTLSDRIAYTVVTEFFPKADYYVDLHCGDGFEGLVSYVYCTGAATPEVAAKSREMAEIAHVDYLVTSMCGTGGAYNYAGSMGIPSILLERGHSSRWCEDLVAEDVHDVKNILRHLGILRGKSHIHGKPPIEVSPVIYEDAPVSGCWYPAKQPGETFKEGEVLGRICDYFGRELFVYRAKMGGIILYQTISLCIMKDTPMVSYGTWDEDTQGKIEVGCEVCGNEKHKHGHHHHKSEEKHHKRHEHHKHHEDK